MNLRNINDLAAANLVTKRDDPNYAQVSGYIPKELARKFKILCTSEEISQSEALEVAVMMWLREKEASSEKPS
jgi:hypothetical protein